MSEVTTPAAGAAPRLARVALPRAGDSRARAWVKYAVGMIVVALLTAWLGGDEYWLTLITGGLLFAGLATSWNVIGGFGGQFSLAHGVFFAIGAYAVALLQAKEGWSAWPALAVGVALTLLLALALAWPLFRLRGPFFAIGTLALAQVALALAGYFSFTGGGNGVQIPFEDAVFTEPTSWAWMMFGYLAVVVAISLLVSRGRLGYYLVAVRDEEEAAAAAGVSPLRVKATGLALSATMTAVGGGLFAMYIGYVDPPTVLSIADIGVMIPLLALLGGIGTVAGPVVGGIILSTGESWLQGELASYPPGISVGVLGLLLILAARFFNQGIWGFATESVARARRGPWRRRGG